MGFDGEIAQYSRTELESRSFTVWPREDVSEKE